MARLDDNVRFAVRQVIMQAMKDICITGGYNTQPNVTDDPEVIIDPDVAQFHLYVAVLDESATEQSPGPTFRMAMEVLLVGYAFRGEGTPQDAVDALLQDVRNAYTAMLQELGDTTGGAVDIKLGDCEVSHVGMLEQEGLGGFVQSMSIDYRVGPGAVW